MFRRGDLVKLAGADIRPHRLVVRVVRDGDAGGIKCLVLNEEGRISRMTLYREDEIVQRAGG